MRRTTVVFYVGVFLVGFGSMLLCGGCTKYKGVDYSEGFRDGYIQKMSHKGLIFKTYECELAMEGFSLQQTKNGTRMANVFEFTVDKQDIVNKVKNIPSGTKVRVHYQEKVFYSPLISDTGYFVVDIEILEKQ